MKARLSNVTVYWAPIGQSSFGWNPSVVSDVQRQVPASAGLIAIPLDTSLPTPESGATDR